MKLEQIDEEVVKRVAKVFGEHSAAALCLEDAQKRRAAGQTPIFFRGMGKHRRVVLVCSLEDQGWEVAQS